MTRASVCECTTVCVNIHMCAIPVGWLRLHLCDLCTLACWVGSGCGCVCTRVPITREIVEKMAPRRCVKKKHDGQQSPLLPYEPYEAFNTPIRLSAVASWDSDCSCSTVSCSVGAASMTSSGGSDPSSQISTDASGRPRISSPPSSLHLHFDEVWLHPSEENAFILVCTCFFVHWDLQDRGHRLMPPRLFADLWAHHGRVTSCGGPMERPSRFRF